MHLRVSLCRIGCVVARAAFVSGFLLCAGTAQASAPGTLDHYIALALENSPRLEAATAVVRASALRSDTIGILSDPEVRYQRTLSGVEAMAGQRQRLAIEQRVAWPTGPWAERRASDYAALATRAQAATVERDVRLMVSRAFWELWLVREFLAARQREESLLASVVSSVRARLEVGRSTLAELATVELALARARDELAALASDERIAAVELAGVIGASPTSDLPTVAACTSAEAQDVREDSSSSPAAEEVARAHPEVHELLAESRAELAMAEAAAARRWPMLGLGVEVVDMVEPNASTTNAASGSGNLVDAWAVMALVSVPLWHGRYAADEESRRSEAAAAVARAEDREREIVSSYRAAALGEREAARRLVTLEQVLVPKARVALEATLGGLTTGRVELRDVLMIERELVELETTRARMCVSRALAGATQRALDGRRPADGPTDATANEVQR